MKVVGLSGSFVTGDRLLLSPVSNNSTIKELDLSLCSCLNDIGIIAILNKIGRSLKILNLSDTDISFSFAESLTSALPMLEELYLECCTQISEDGLMAFLNRTGETLKILNLSCTSVTLSSVESLVSTLPVLEELNLQTCYCLTNAGIMAFLNKIGETLKILNLSCTSVTLSSVESLVSTLPALEELHLMKCTNLTDAGLIAFINKTGESLKILDLRRTTISLSSVESLASNLPVLKELCLQDCYHLNDDGLITFLNKTGESLKILDLRRTTISFSSVESLTSTLPGLKKLQLGSCQQLGDEGLIAFLNKTGESIKILDLSWTKVSFSSVESLTSCLPVLEELYLQRCDQISDDGLMAFLNKSWESLKILNLSSTRLSFSSVESMTSCLPVLEKLDLSFCCNITEAGLVTFLGKTSGRVELRLQHTTVDVNRIQAAYPNLTGDFPFEIWAESKHKLSSRI